MRFRLNAPHYINDQLLPAGMEIGDNTGFHFNGIPSMHMTALDEEGADAIQKHGIHKKRRPRGPAPTTSEVPIYHGPAAKMVQVRKDIAPKMSQSVEQTSVGEPQPRQPAMQPQPHRAPEGDSGVSQVQNAPNPMPAATPANAPQSFEPVKDGQGPIKKEDDFKIDSSKDKSADKSSTSKK